MAEPLTFDTLVEFHRKIVAPDLERIFERLTGVENRVGGLRDEMLSHFDAIYKRFDRLESEYQAWRCDRSCSS